MQEEDSREAILRCALELFSRKGYEGTGVQKICEDAGIAKPTLYYHFGSKEGLLESVLSENFTELEQRLMSIEPYSTQTDIYEKDIYPVVLDIISVHFEFARRRPLFYMMIISMSFSPKDSVVAPYIMPYLKKQYDGVKAYFTQISSVHTGLKGKEHFFALNLLAMINAAIGFWNGGKGELDMDTAQKITKQFMHGIFSI